VKLALDHISVWSFEKAPEEIQKIADQGGDEDWVVFVPKEFGFGTCEDLEGWKPYWLDVMDSCRQPVVITVDDGIFYVGCH